MPYRQSNPGKTSQAGIRKFFDGICICLLPALISAGSLYPQVSWAQSKPADQSPPLSLESISWQPIKGAAYYDGTLRSEGSEKFNFRTKGRLIFVKMGSEVAIAAYNAKGQRLKARPKMVKEIVSAESANEIPIAPPLQPEVSPKNENEPDYFNPDASDNGDSSISSEATDDSKPRVRVVRPVWIKDWQTSLSIGIGSEKLTSTGGGSDFSGKANFSSMNVGGFVNTSVKSPPVLFEYRISAHEFATTTETLAADGAQAKQVDAHLRASAYGGGWTDLFNYLGNPPGNSLLLAGVGGIYSRTPALEVGNMDTSEAKLKSFSGIGPFGGLRFVHLLNSSTQSKLSSHRFSAGVIFSPILIGAVKKGTIALIDGGWGYHFSENLFADVGLKWRRDSLGVEAGCGVSTSCREKSTSKSSIQAVEVGIGASF